MLRRSLPSIFTKPVNSPLMPWSSGRSSTAGAAAADDAEHRAGRHLEAHPVERRVLAPG